LDSDDKRENHSAHIEEKAHKWRIDLLERCRFLSNIQTAFTLPRESQLPLMLSKCTELPLNGPLSEFAFTTAVLNEKHQTNNQLLDDS